MAVTGSKTAHTTQPKLSMETNLQSPTMYLQAYFIQLSMLNKMQNILSGFLFMWGSDQRVKGSISKVGKEEEETWGKKVHSFRKAVSPGALWGSSDVKSVTYLGPLSIFVFFNKQWLIFFPQIFWHFVAAVMLSVWSRLCYTLFALSDRAAGILNLMGGWLHHEDWPVWQLNCCNLF